MAALPSELRSPGNYCFRAMGYSKARMLLPHPMISLCGAPASRASLACATIDGSRSEEDVVPYTSLSVPILAGKKPDALGGIDIQDFQMC